MSRLWHLLLPAFILRLLPNIVDLRMSPQMLLAENTTIGLLHLQACLLLIDKHVRMPPELVLAERHSCVVLLRIVGISSEGVEALLYFIIVAVEFVCQF